MAKLAYYLALGIFVCGLHGVPAYAAKKPVGVIVNTSEVGFASVAVKVVGKKKKRNYPVVCYNGRSGKGKNTAKGYLFTSYALLLKKPLDSKTKSLYQALNKGGRKACVNGGGSGGGGGGQNLPDYLSLDQYTGAFGETQVRRLFEVFALGGSESWVQPSIARGLQATADDLLTYKEEPELEAFVTKLSCDPDFDDGVDECFENQNPNDYYLDGLISAINLRAIKTKNPVHAALREWVMDVQAPGNPRGLDSQNRWMFKRHIEQVIEPFVRSGNLRQYVLDYTNDSFGHGKWLSGAANHAGPNFVGNEDFSRELMQRLTMNTVDKNGVPNYNDLDVLSGSLALSGLAERSVKDSNGNDVKVIGFFPDLHSEGAHVLWGGTPYQTTIYDAEDFVNAIFTVKADQMAFETAKRLWNRFISSKATVPALEKLAEVIKANNFNLYPALKVMMMSKAFYAPESKDTILKNPSTLFMTYARMTGIPVNDYNSLRGWLDELGMLLGRTPTVFGFTYQNKLLASDVFQLSRFNSLFYYTMWQDFEEIKERFGWTPHSGLIAGMPLSGHPGEDVVSAFARRLNIADSLTPLEKEQYIIFIEHYLGDCNDPDRSDCFQYEGSWRQLFRDPPDFGDSDSDFYRARLLLVMLAAKDAFQVM